MPGASNQDSARIPNPWWVPAFLGRVPAQAEERHVRLLGAVAIALFVEEYDLAMLMAALKPIAESFGSAEADLPVYLGIMRLGAIPAFFLIPFADRIGRRRVFLASMVGMGTLTLFSAFSQTMWQFVTLQVLTRTFFVAGSAIAFVMVTEEFPAKNRGWAIGLLGALAAVGHGAGTALYGLVEWLPYGWRSLYVVGFLPVVFIGAFSRAIPETKRFDEYNAGSHASEHVGLWSWAAPIKSLVQRQPVRALCLGLVGFLPSVGLISAFSFAQYYLQTDHGYGPAASSAVIIVGGSVALAGNVLAGHLSDRFGRRRVGSALFVAFPFAVAVFYMGPSWVVPIGWILVVTAGQGGRLVTRAVSTELFPTSERAAASGLYTVLETCGAAAGLFILYAYTSDQAALAAVIPWLATAAAASGLLLLLFPETKQLELEAIAMGGDADLPPLVDPDVVLAHTDTPVSSAPSAASAASAPSVAPAAPSPAPAHEPERPAP